MIEDCESSAYFGTDPEPYPLGLVPPDIRVRRIVEVGPGAGAGTLQVLERFPDSRLTCLEPGDAARSTVVWRVLDRALGGRVTVLPVAVQEAPGGMEADLVLARHVTCQVPLAERLAFWQSMARLLGPFGHLLVDDHFGPTSSEDSPRRRAADGMVGEVVVSRWFSARAIDDFQLRVRNEYVFEDASGVELSRHVRTDVHEVVDMQEQLAVVADAGLRVVTHTDGWVLLARAGRPVP